MQQTCRNQRTGRPIEPSWDQVAVLSPMSSFPPEWTPHPRPTYLYIYRERGERERERNTLWRKRTQREGGSSINKKEQSRNAVLFFNLFVAKSCISRKEQQQTQQQQQKQQQLNDVNNANLPSEPLRCSLHLLNLLTLHVGKSRQQLTGGSWQHFVLIVRYSVKKQSDADGMQLLLLFVLFVYNVSTNTNNKECDLAFVYLLFVRTL